MITVYLRGGLGNQLFQYALGLHLAQKNNTELVLNTVYLSDRTPRKNFSHRAYELSSFTIQARFTVLSRVARAFPIPLLWLGLDLIFIKLRALFGLQKIVREQNEAYDSSVLSMRGNLLLFGRWQSEQYFVDAANEVRDALCFKPSPTPEGEALMKKIQSVNAVSVHVRRGDYAAFANVAQMMGQTNLDYYKKAVTYIVNQVSRPHFFVFSDDINWCKENLIIPGTATYVTPIPGTLAAFDMQLMSLCKHNIIANSTFSWWGAWLNKNPNKIVIAPERWYADGRGVEADLIPKSWICL